MLEFRDVQYAHLKARIHRPTLRNRTPSHEDRSICLQACSLIIEDYQRQLENKRLFYPWHGVHILFEAAVIMLDACWCSRDWQQMRHQARCILSVTLPDCLSLLEKLGQLWYESMICAEHLRPLLNEVSQAFTTRMANGIFVDEDIRGAYDLREASTTEKLRLLLFPDTPLAWNFNYMTRNSRHEADLQTSIATLETASVENFQWDANWDLSDFLYGSLEFSTNRIPN